MSLRLMEDRIWLSTDRTPLRDVMTAFANLGIDVHLDPSIQANIHGTLEDVDVEEALKELLGPFNYVLQWRQIQGPVGPLIQLKSMIVFQPGKRDLARPISGPKTLDVVRPANGPAYVKEELLLALNSNISPDAFKVLLARIGGTVVESLHPPGIYRIRLGANADVPSLVALLGTEDAVYHAEPNYVYDGIGTDTLESGGEGGRLTDIPSPAPGQPSVAVLDSGLQSMEGLDSQIIAGLDATDPGAELQDPSGHGTQMALIAAGLVIPFTGQAINQAVPVVAVRAFDEQGQSSGYDILEGLAFAAEKGASVVNMSWGSEASSTFLHDTLKKASARDMILVAAAGNDPSGRPVYPAAFSEVLSVGALGSDGSRWSQSNFGSFIDLTAPGSAQLPIGHNGPPGSYGGTSISSAYTSKLLAIYRQRHPDVSAEGVVSAMKDSLTDLGAPGRDNYYGSGALDNAAISQFLK